MFSFPGRGDLSGSDGTGLQKGPVARNLDKGDATASAGQMDPARFRSMVDRTDPEYVSMDQMRKAAPDSRSPAPTADGSLVPRASLASSDHDGTDETSLVDGAGGASDLDGTDESFDVEMETDIFPAPASDTEPVSGQDPLVPLPSGAAPELAIPLPVEVLEDKSRPFGGDAGQIPLLKGKDTLLDGQVFGLTAQGGDTAVRREQTDRIANPGLQFEHPNNRRHTLGPGLLTEEPSEVALARIANSGSDDRVSNASRGGHGVRTSLRLEHIEWRAELANSVVAAHVKSPDGPVFKEGRPVELPRPPAVVENPVSDMDPPGQFVAKSPFVNSAVVQHSGTLRSEDRAQPATIRPFAAPYDSMARVSSAREPALPLIEAWAPTAGRAAPELATSQTTSGRSDARVPVLRESNKRPDTAAIHVSHAAPSGSGSPWSHSNPAQISAATPAAGTDTEKTDRDLPVEAPTWGRVATTETMARPFVAAVQHNAAPAISSFGPGGARAPDWAGMPAVTVDPVPDTAFSSTVPGSTPTLHGVGTPASVASGLPAPPVAHQIGLALHGPSGSETILRLEPEELGRVTLGLRGDERSMTLFVNAERPETLELIRRSIQDLASELADMGYEDIAFDFGDAPDRDKPERHVPATEMNQNTESRTDGFPAPQQAVQQTATGHVDIRL